MISLRSFVTANSLSSIMVSYSVSVERTGVGEEVGGNRDAYFLSMTSWDDDPIYTTNMYKNSKYEIRNISISGKLEVFGC